MAEQSAPCDMDNMSAMEVMVQDQLAYQTNPLAESHVGHEQPAMDNQCCCNDACVGNCDMGMTVSLLMQVSPYTPVVVNTEKLILFSPALLVRALTPPSRPPLTIS